MSVELGHRMREIALRPEFFDELGDFGYLDGGCRIYAEAAAEFLGHRAELAYVIAEGDAFGPIVDHAVVIAGDEVYDGDGAAPLEGYLGRYARLEHRANATLELVHAEDVEADPRLAEQAHDLPENRRLSSRLAAAWRSELGEPAR